LGLQVLKSLARNGWRLLEIDLTDNRITLDGLGQLCQGVLATGARPVTPCIAQPADESFNEFGASKVLLQLDGFL